MPLSRTSPSPGGPSLPHDLFLQVVALVVAEEPPAEELQAEDVVGFKREGAEVVEEVEGDEVE